MLKVLTLFGKKTHFQQRSVAWFSDRIRSVGEYQKLVRVKSYARILQVQPSSSLAEVKKNYRTLLKQHHPDMAGDSGKSDSERITQILIQAYSEYRKAYIAKHGSAADEKEDEKDAPSQIKRKEPSQMTQDELKYYEIFGKTFEEDPYSYYSQANLKKRQDYENYRVKKYGAVHTKHEQNAQTKQRTASPDPRENQKKIQRPASSSQDSSQQAMMFLAGGVGMLFILLYLKNTDQKPARCPMHSEQIQQTPAKKPYFPKPLVQGDQKQIKDMKTFRPKMLKYPGFLEPDPPIEEQLLKYSIFPDIELYEVDCHAFDIEYARASEDKDIKDLRVRPSFIRAQANTLMTLALEAERCLQNIYVSKSDVLTQLKQTGTYKPPGVFFRFYGYIHFRLRENKPIIMESTGPNDDWISLYDLYFAYYSPLPFKYTKYNEYWVSEEGNVHFNYRKIPLIFLRKGQKNVYMYRYRDSFRQTAYIKVWSRFHSSKGCQAVV